MKMLIAVLLSILTLTSCDPQLARKIEVEDRITHHSIKLPTEENLLKLYKDIQYARDEKTIAKMEGETKRKYLNHLENLVKHYNDASESLSNQYSDKQKRELETHYLKAKEVWDFIVANYKI